jgi:diaminopimelate decarboxylase
VRINPDIGSGECSHVITAGRDTKFGIPFQDTAKLHEAIEKSGVKVVGLHQHIGSNIMQQDFDKYTESVRCIFNMAAQFPELEFINIGGGIGIPYRKRDIPLDLNEAYKRVG